MSCCNHWQSSTSDLRPETFLTWRALTSSTAKPRASSSSNTGIQYTPVDSIATVSTPHALSQSAMRSRSAVKLGNSRTGSSSRSGGTATKCAAVPVSRPAALGWVMLRAARDLTGFSLRRRLRLGWSKICSKMRWGKWHRIGNVVLLTLSNGISTPRLHTAERFTNVDDVTHDHAHTRANMHHCLIGLPQRHIPLCLKTAPTVSSARLAARGRLLRSYAVGNTE